MFFVFFFCVCLFFFFSRSKFYPFRGDLNTHGLYLRVKQAGHQNQSAEGAGGLGIIRSNKVGETE